MKRSDSKKIDQDIKQAIEKCKAVFDRPRNAEKGYWDEMPLARAFKMLEVEVFEFKNALLENRTIEENTSLAHRDDLLLNALLDIEDEVADVINFGIICHSIVSKMIRAKKQPEDKERSKNLWPPAKQD